MSSGAESTRHESDLPEPQGPDRTREVVDAIGAPAREVAAHVHVDGLPDASVIVRKKDGTVVVTFQASRILHTEGIKYLEKELLQLAGLHRKILLDFSCVEYFSSAFLNTLFKLHKEMAVSGKLRMCGISTDVNQVLTITAFDRVFDCHWQDQETALQDFAESQEK